MAKLTNNEKGDYTHVLVVDSTSLARDGGATGSSYSYTIATPGIGAFNEVVDVYVPTDFDGGATSELTVAVGLSGDTDGLITAQSIHADGTPINSATVDGDDLTAGGDANTLNGVAVAAADTLTATFTLTGGNGFGDLTQGKVIIGVRVRDLSRFA